MSRTTDKLIEKMEAGELMYDQDSNTYMTPNKWELKNEISYLEWRIASTKAELQDKVYQFNRYDI